MRKIEEQMLEAIRTNRNWSKDNTMVNVTDSNVEVFLHGNHIANVVNGLVEVIKETALYWPTRTTMSRLRALGVNVNVKQGEVIFHESNEYVLV